MLRFKKQVILLVPVITLSVFLFLSNPEKELDDVIGLISETIYLLVCLVLFLKIEDMSQTKNIYNMLLFSLLVLIVGGTLDVVDEFRFVPTLIEGAEDVFKSLGFVVFIITCFRWVDFHKCQTQEMQKLSEIDSLTGLSNRRSFFHISRRYFELEQYSDASILLVDIDLFKSINDKYGHSFGDKVLKKVASTLKVSLRDDDYIARIGGEEFIVLLKDTSLEDVELLAEKLRVAVEEVSLIHEGEQIKCTVSIGISMRSSSCSEFEVLFNKADKALYKAKSEGRNCYRVSN